MGLSHKIPHIFFSEFRGFRRAECRHNFFMRGLDVSILLSGKNVPLGYCTVEDFEDSERFLAKSLKRLGLRITIAGTVA